MPEKGVTKEFLAERDLRIFKMRQAGVPNQEIARRLGISTRSVTNAIQRQLAQLNREALATYPEILRLELERLDALQQAIWPLTQHRKITLPDGTETTVEPDLKAISQVLTIMDKRAKLLGIEQNIITLNIEPNDTPQRATLAGTQQAIEANAFDPETEARQLLELAAISGIIPEHTVQALLNQPKQLEEAEIIETPPNQTQPNQTQQN